MEKKLFYFLKIWKLLNNLTLLITNREENTLFLFSQTQRHWKRLTGWCHVQWCPSVAWWPHTALEGRCGTQGRWRTRWSPESWRCLDALSASLEASVLLPPCSRHPGSPDLQTHNKRGTEVSPGQSALLQGPEPPCPLSVLHRINKKGIATGLKSMKIYIQSGPHRICEWERFSHTYPG